MVRAAVLTAFRASISTPVLPVTFTCAAIARRPAPTTVKSIATTWIGNGWHMGITSAVRFAAMMPATRATASTSPLTIFPARISCSVRGRMRMTPRATASRSLIGLSLTSTMRARPRASTWDNRALRVFRTVIINSDTYEPLQTHHHRLRPRGSHRRVVCGARQPRPCGDRRLPTRRPTYYHDRRGKLPRLSHRHPRSRNDGPVPPAGGALWNEDRLRRRRLRGPHPAALHAHRRQAGVPRRGVDHRDRRLGKAARHPVGKVADGPRCLSVRDLRRVLFQGEGAGRRRRR